MTTYAPVPAFAERKSAPKTLTIIIAGHAVLLAAVITAKMDLPASFGPTRTVVDLIEAPKDPPPPEPRAEPTAKPVRSVIDRPLPLVPLPAEDDAPAIDTTPVVLPNSGPVIGPSRDPVIDLKPVPKPLPVRTGPRFATPDSQLRPPYPADKISSEEEASLRLRLTIDERGRVTAVDPVGAADASFLTAARKHLIAHWRYRPATEDGRAVASSTVITLRFLLDE
ncbi:hypothetical protein G7078_01070 [Sphingomonas sinipercae]|uniref:TonB C-terminal domain-containing protein n=1 Tax=Sphingomonas sinipercae TaxID=2714944 RepID=A0A6G7ZKS3_9SPHN|nr:energy transducer TonB [Sphingomonas sinipercae]QIL01518.1 hypothetical protein G7078_01070 [Sphingomonas sinipercae]